MPSTTGQNRKKHRLNSHPIIHCPTSEGVSEVSERANERTDERVTYYCSLYSWLFWTIVTYVFTRTSRLTREGHLFFPVFCFITSCIFFTLKCSVCSIYSTASFLFPTPHCEREKAIRKNGASNQCFDTYITSVDR